MSKLSIEELVSGLLESAMVAQSISQRQHINSLKNYFNDDGTPKVVSFQVDDRQVDFPLYILADHGSVGLDKLDIEFEARLLFGQSGDEVSQVKKDVMGLFKEKGDTYKHNIKSISVDSTKSENSGVAKIKVRFKADERPEAVSRLLDLYINTLEDPTKR